MFSPQKVAKIVTSSPMAAAPLAMMSAAITRSKSPLNRMIVFLVVSTPAPPVLSDRCLPVALRQDAYASRRYCEMSLKRIVSPAALLRFTKHIGHMVTASGAASRSCATRFSALAIALAG